MEPPGTAPGSEPLITRAFMSIVPLQEHTEYQGLGAGIQGGIWAFARSANHSFKAKAARVVARASGWISQ